MKAIRRVFKLAFWCILIFCAISCTSAMLSSCDSSTESNNGPIATVTVNPSELLSPSVESDEEDFVMAGEDGIYVEFESKVDGDTAWFSIPDGDHIQVRFLGIDTPETVKEGTDVQEWGPEASEYTTSRLSNAHEIYLEFDPESDREDAYGRILAWVWVDGSLIEKELIEQGLAEVAYIYGDYLYTDMLLDAQESAQQFGVGMWGTQRYSDVG